MGLDSILEQVAALPPQFEYRQYQDKVLLLDGDFLVYKAAANATNLKQAVTRFYTMCMAEAFLVGVQDVRCYITPTACKKCDRRLYPSVLQYQANRLIRQFMPWKEPLKTHLITNPNEYAHKNISLHFSDYFEADDLMVMDSHRYKYKSILSSGDKDLRVTPYPFWEQKTGTLSEINDRYGHIRLDMLTATTNIKGHGTKFFHAQLLMGDAVDNVKGLKHTLTSKDKQVGMGVVKTWKILDGFQDEEQSLRFIIGMYRQINQNILAEAELLWLRRHEEDSGYRYMQEFDFKAEIRQYIDDCNDKNIEALKSNCNGVREYASA